MTQPTTMTVVIDDLRATSGVMNDIASGFYNDGGGPILKSVTSADTELDSTKACARWVTSCWPMRRHSATVCPSTPAS